MLRIAVAGASGRMGRMLIEAVMDSPDTELAAALDLPSSPALGHDAAEFAGRRSGVVIRADAAAALAGAQVLIDFSRPEGTLNHLQACLALGVKAVIGTTGFTPAQKAEIEAAAQHVAIVFAPNMSVGVNVMLGLLASAARALGEGYDIEVLELHHRHKVDAPSGTALAMGEVLAGARGVALSDAGVFARHGVKGARVPGSIGFAALRGGDIVGEHTVFFSGAGERLEFSHKSSSRANYADGSLRAARFVAGRASGLYGMNDVLGLP